MHSRRSFIKQCLAVSAGFSGINSFLSHRAEAFVHPMHMAAEKWLELPKGFTARVISRWGDKMSDGFLVPGRADGMAAFAHSSKVVLIRNHENNPSPAQYGPFGESMQHFSNVDRKDVYDFGYGKTPSLGGTTTLIFNETSQTVEQQFLSLVGTNRNCAGGPTPWNSWITCEEDTTRKGDIAEHDHGYNFEIPAAGKGLINPVPIKSMGRFNHEAVCVDPATGIVYQTEDAGDSLIYRFIPDVPGKLHQGGQLQALAIDGSSFDTRNWNSQNIQVGQPLNVTWIPLKDVDTKDDDLRLRGAALGAAVFARGEGMWFGNKELYFACTNGGSRKAGQIFKYIPSAKEGTMDEKKNSGKLVLFAEPNDTEILKYCDNLTVAPWGDVIIVEDSKDAYMRGITPTGKIYNIGRNIGSSSELAGVCFSPSGKTMFVNIQEDGLTFAVTGPWQEIRT